MMTIRQFQNPRFNFILNSIFNTIFSKGPPKALEFFLIDSYSESHEKQ
jgi:hypothetical protein